jgi:hypothetical protein
MVDKINQLKQWIDTPKGGIVQTTRATPFSNVFDCHYATVFHSVPLFKQKRPKAFPVTVITVHPSREWIPSGILFNIVFFIFTVFGLFPYQGLYPIKYYMVIYVKHYYCIYLYAVVNEAMPSEKPKIIFVATEELEERIDIYWHEKRLRNRSEAIRQLLEESLDRHEKSKK